MRCIVWMQMASQLCHYIRQCTVTLDAPAEETRGELNPRRADHDLDQSSPQTRNTLHHYVQFQVITILLLCPN